MDEITTAQREALIAERRAQRVPFHEIARELGISRQRVQQIWNTTLDRIPAAHLDQHREEERELADDAIRDLLRRIHDPNTSTNSAVRAWEVACKWAERKSRLLGLDAPVRREVEITDTSSWEYEMRQAIAETERELRATRIADQVTRSEDDT
jgi:hypothetical protein